MKHAALVFACLVAAAVPARAQEAAPPPPATPPAAPAAEKPGWMVYKNPYAAAKSDLSAADHTNEEALSWASRAVAEVLTFPAASLETRIKTARTYFAETGWAGYAGQLRDSAILAAAQDARYAVTTTADGDPMLVNTGAMNGVWHWEVRLPVMTTISQKAADGELRPVSTKKTRLTLLVGRAGEDGVEGLSIRSWVAEALDSKP